MYKFQGSDNVLLYIVKFSGMSSTFTGQRLPKDSDIFEALGCNDELNSTVGLVAIQMYIP